MKTRKKNRSRFPALLTRIERDAELWCSGRQWLPRAALLLLLGYIAWQHLVQPMYQDPFKALNLGLHEIGHYLFAFAGEFITVSGGSLFQCLVPIGSMFMFLKQRDYFAVAISWGWLATNLYDVAIYAGDARLMNLPLVSPGASEEIIHDWHFILERLHLLAYDQAIARLIQLAASCCMLICLLSGTWLCITMYQSRKTIDLKAD